MPSASREHVVQVWQRLGGNIKQTADEIGIARSTVQYHLRRAGVYGKKPLVAGKRHADKPEERKAPKVGVKRYILTSAQNNTRVNTKLWDNLQALAKHHGAELLVASYTYNTNAYGKLAVKRGTEHEYQSDLWYDERVRPYLEKSDQNIELAPGLVWCGRMNTLPSAAEPLRGFQTYTGRASGIFPHAKIAMQSVASNGDEPAKFNYTTGTVTEINYIQKTAGLRAEFHHTYGALLVEVDSDGDWFVRQLNADKSGTLYDLDTKVQEGVVSTGNRVEGITWGDIHVAQIDPDVARLGWGKGGMLDTLKPKYQFFHDLVDFYARNHHDARNPHKRFKVFVEGVESVEKELFEAAAFLKFAERGWCKGVVVDSNHDNQLSRWLGETDWRSDLVNAEFYCEAQSRILKSIRERDENFHIIEWAMTRADPESSPRFLREEESFVICKDAHGGIECGMHGHLGIDGAKGSPKSFSRMGRKANTAHTHSAGIVDSVYTAGHTCKRRVGYNRGPSSWSQSEIVTYPNGKRAIVTLRNGKWRA